MGNEILKHLKMPSDVAAGRGSVCNWLIKAARHFSEFDNSGKC